MQKLIPILVLVSLLLPFLLASCNTAPPQETTPSISTPEDVGITVPAYALDSITDAGVLKRAAIITGENDSEVYAGEELADYLTQKGVEIAENGFPIFLFQDVTMSEDSFSIDATLYGDEACMIIRGGNGRGVLYGVYKFLEEYAGVRYFMPDLEKIPESDIVLKEGNLLYYTPFFEERRLAWHCSKNDTDWNLKNGVNGHDGDVSDEKYGGKKTYAGGLFVHTIGKLTETGGATSPNPCLSDPENLAKVIKNVRAILEKEPDANIVSVSQNDSSEYCTCKQCAAVDAEEGSPAGLMLRFVNAVAENLEEDYPDLIIDTLAYNYTQAIPNKTVPRHNVCVRVCAIRCCFMHPMTECPDAWGPNGIQWTRTAAFLKDFVDWGKICDRIYVWEYTTNYTYYIPPFSNFGALRENMRFYHKNGVRGMFPQGNSQSASGEFGELRTYLLAKLMWNPYMTEEEYYRHMNEFLEAYYGEGWQNIRSFIDLTIELVANEGSCIFIYEEPLQSITKEEYLQYEEQIEAWWNAAEELAGDRLAYIQRSRLQWRYIQLLLHPDDEACAQFVADVEAWDIRWAESPARNKPLNEMFPSLYPVNKS